MSSRVTTVTDCGTSSSGVEVLVALTIAPTWYPPGAVTVTASRTPSTCSRNSEGPAPGRTTSTRRSALRNPSAWTRTVYSPAGTRRVNAPSASVMVDTDVVVLADVATTCAP